MRELERLPWLAVYAARAEMASWYADHGREPLVQVRHRLQFAPGTREGLALLSERGSPTALCSMTWGFAVEEIARGLGIRWHVGTDLSPAGEIAHCLRRTSRCGPANSARGSGSTHASVAAVGDSWGDIPLLRSVPVAYFVGPERPPELAGRAMHLSAADIREIARRVVAIRQ